MKNKLTRLCASFWMATVVAATSTGCSSLPPTTTTTDHCMVGTRAEGTLLLVFSASVNTGETYSKSCRDGKAAANATLIGRNAEGKLHPVGAAFSLQFYQDLKEQIQDGTESVKAYAGEVKTYFEGFLKQLGGLTIDDVQKQFDDMVAARQKIKAQQTPEPTPPAATNKCNGHGILKSCEQSKDPAP